MRHVRCVIVFFLLSVLFMCSTAEREKEFGVYRKPDKYNFKFVGYDTGINNPENDRRAYYRVFIDKAEEGRTTTGLESQEKTFEALLTPNRHLVIVVKWVLDKKAGRYVKLNNIEQPRPNYVYFNLPEDGAVTVELRSTRNRSSIFHVSTGIN